MQKRTNVVFIATTNFITNVDPAFVDRCRYKQFVGAPLVEAGYEILRSQINEYIDNGLISAGTLIFGEAPNHGRQSSEALWGAEIFSEGAPTTIPQVPIRPLPGQTSGGDPPDSQHVLHIPPMTWATFHWPAGTVTAASELERIAGLGRGFSARNLRGLVTLALFKYTANLPCDLREYLETLGNVVREETGDRKKCDAPQTRTKVSQDRADQQGGDEEESDMDDEEIERLMQEVRENAKAAE